MQWLRLHTAVDAGSVSGWETKMPQAVRPKKKKKKNKGSLDLVPALNIFTILWVYVLKVILALSHRSILVFFNAAGSVSFFSLYLFIYFGCAGSLLPHVGIL